MSFFAITTYRLFSGSYDCGCAGVIEIPAWVSLLINLFVILSLFATSRQLSVEGIRQAFQLRELGDVAGLSLAFVVVILISSDFGRSFMAQFGYGEQVTGNVVSVRENDQNYYFQIQLHNLSPFDANLIGQERSCKCISVLPGDGRIPANGQSKEILVVVAETSRDFRHGIDLFVDHPHQRSVRVILQNNSRVAD